MQIRSIAGLLARCEAKGVEPEANLLMLQHESRQNVSAHDANARFGQLPDTARRESVAIEATAER